MMGRQTAVLDGLIFARSEPVIDGGHSTGFDNGC